MPIYKAYLGQVRNPLPVKEMITRRSENERANPFEVRLEGDWNAKLQYDHPVTKAWADIMDWLQDNNRPVYLEIDHIPEDCAAGNILPGNW